MKQRSKRCASFPECNVHVINLSLMTMYTLSVFRAKTLKESVNFNNHGFCRPFSVLHGI